jgi:hypothetical protein
MFLFSFRSLLVNACELDFRKAGIIKARLSQHGGVEPGQKVISHSSSKKERKQDAAKNSYPPSLVWSRLHMGGMLTNWVHWREATEIFAREREISFVLCFSLSFVLSLID